MVSIMVVVKMHLDTVYVCGGVSYVEEEFDADTIHSVTIVCVSMCVLC